MIQSIYSECRMHPNMSESEAARLWMIQNECTDNGLAAIYTDGDNMSVNYDKTPYGISIICKNGTAIPVPYKCTEHTPVVLL